MSSYSKGRFGVRLGLVIGLMTIGCGSDDGGNRALPAPSGLTDEDVVASVDEDVTTPPTDEGQPPMDEGQPPMDEGQPPKGANVLTYADQNCGSPCAVVLDNGVQAELAVTYRDADGMPIADALVSFDTQDSELLLGAKTAYTTAEGRAAVSVSATQGAKGTFEVSATVSNDSEAGNLRFTVTATAEAPAPLQVTVSYVGSGAASQVELRLFLQEGGKPICSDVHPDAVGSKPTAVTSKPGVGITTTTTFPQLPGLDENTPQQTWMVQAIAGEATAPVASGCTQGIAVTWGEQATASVEVADLPLKFKGTVDVTTDLDMYTGVGGDGATALGWIIGIFDSPGATALKAACADPSGFLDTACGFLVDGSGEPSGLGTSVAELGDEAFYGLMSDNLGEGFTFTGTSIAALLKEMRLRSTLEFSQEPSVPTDAGADFASGSVTETWDTVSYYWKFGLNCDPSSPNYDTCGLQTVKLTDIYSATLLALPDAGVTTDNHMAIDVHTVTGFNYGTLLNFIVEKKVLPTLFGDGQDGFPVINTYGALVATLFGDKYCLLPEYNDCCEWFAYKVQDQIADWIATPACEAAIPAADFFIRDLVTGLGGPLQIGTKADAACPAVDLQGDRQVDTLGSAENKCEWDANFDISGATFTPDNSWFGKYK